VGAARADAGAELQLQLEEPVGCGRPDDNVQRWSDMPRGGHFAALEEPELLAEDLRSFFGDLSK
jgi:hypothetical protein